MGHGRPRDAQGWTGDLHNHYDSSLVGVQLGHNMKTPKAAAQLRLGPAALLVVTMVVTPHARAESVYDYQRRPLPCNELCQAWLGSNKSDRTDSTGESTGPAQPRARLREGFATSAAPKGKVPHAGPEPGKTAALPPTVPSLVESDSEPPASLRHPRPAATHVAATHVPRSVPLPVPRPDFPVPPAVTVVEVRPLPAFSSELPSLEPHQLRAPDKSAAASASGDQVTRPASNAAARPPAVQGVVGPAPAPSGTRAPKMAREPAENTFNAPAEIKREPGEAGRELDDKQVPHTAIATLPNPLPGGGGSEVPSAGKASNVAQPAPAPTLTDPEKGPRDDPALVVEPHTGDLASMPALEPGPVLVNVGQIKTDARNTYVDVLVINTSEHKLQDLAVRCDARDAQGLQVGQGSTTIRDVPPSDVTFGQALFPSQITGDNSKFSCVAEKFSEPHGPAP